MELKIVPWQVGGEMLYLVVDPKSPRGEQPAVQTDLGIEKLVGSQGVRRLGRHLVLG